MEEANREGFVRKDIFISYKDDVAGNSFACRLYDDLTKKNYSVYFNPKEKRSGAFPERLRNAITGCKDFLLILTPSCLEQLIRHDKIDWIREEILIAKDAPGCTIIPLLTKGAEMPRDKNVMPEDLRFLPDCDAVTMSEPFERSPLDIMLGFIRSLPSEKSVYDDAYNTSDERNIDADLNAALEVLNGNGADPAADEKLLELANLYYFGLVGDGKGCVRDHGSAAKALEKLSAYDTPYGTCANSMMGEMYFYGAMPRSDQSYKKAYEFHEKAKDVSGFSFREYAYLTSRGCGCEFNYDSVVECYEGAIESGDLLAINGLATFYMRYGKFTKAAELYARTRNVSVESEFKLGMLYRDGLLSDPPKPDFYMAAACFQRAISRGKCDSEVYHQLGRLYFTPVNGFTEDFRLAEEYFKTASDMGNKSAQYKLGIMYEYGFVNTDIERAIRYFELAAAQGDPKSAYHLAMLYQRPEYKNYRKAFEFARFAAENGLMEGEFLYAIFLFYGRGCPANEDKAYDYFRRAFGHGMYQAKIYLDKYN